MKLEDLRGPLGKQKQKHHFYCSTEGSLKAVFSVPSIWVMNRCPEKLSCLLEVIVQKQGNYLQMLAVGLVMTNPDARDKSNHRGLQLRGCLDGHEQTQRQLPITLVARLQTLHAVSMRC